MLVEAPRWLAPVGYKGPAPTRKYSKAHRHGAPVRAQRVILPGFVNKLDLDGEHGEADEAPIVEEGTEGVRLMTLHKAKGLQFPVLVLADPTCNAERDDPNRHVDTVRRVWLEPLCGSASVELLEAAAEEQQREQDEAIRVAYVATTRARDLLVVPVCGDQEIDGWLAVLDPVLYPPHKARLTSSPAVGCHGALGGSDDAVRVPS